MSPAKLVNVAEMQRVERQADASGLTYPQMMENAGRNLAQAVLDHCRRPRSHSALGLVGSGNNGGDTLVALTGLAEQGWKATAYIARPRQADDPLIEKLAKSGGIVLNIVEEDRQRDFNRLSHLLADNAVLLDGILGTGVRLPLKPEAASVLAAAQSAIAGLSLPPFVIAVDCPSGVDCDSGEAAPECIPANLTVTMAAVKSGLLKFPAYKLAGKIEVVSIGRLDDLEAWQSVNRQVADKEWVQTILPPRPLDAHKGTFGTAIIAAGSLNYTGAALLSGQAAYRVGAGLVSMAVPAPLHPALAGQFTEATWILLPDEGGFIAKSGAPELLSQLGRATALLFGPGFGMQETTRGFIDGLLGSGQQLPALIADADGLKLLASIPDWPAKLPGPAVLTPHPGEMTVLTGIPVNDIQANRLETAEKYARQWKHVVVLKGAFTVIASPDGHTMVIPVATPALARAGTGDVLSGLITGLRAQGVEAFQAAAAGAWIHAQAGLDAAASMGNTASVLAGDVLRAVPQVITELQ